MATEDEVRSNINEELRALAIDLYNNGYHCGITDGNWFVAYAEAMRRIAFGEEYSENLVFDIYDSLPRKQ